MAATQSDPQTKIEYIYRLAVYLVDVLRVDSGLLLFFLLLSIRLVRRVNILLVQSYFFIFTNQLLFVLGLLSSHWFSFLTKETLQANYLYNFQISSEYNAFQPKSNIWSYNIETIRLFSYSLMKYFKVDGR